MKGYLGINILFVFSQILLDDPLCDQDCYLSDFEGAN